VLEACDSGLRRTMGRQAGRRLQAVCAGWAAIERAAPACIVVLVEALRDVLAHPRVPDVRLS
jgi:hypothetical protein